MPRHMDSGLIAKRRRLCIAVAACGLAACGSERDKSRVVVEYAQLASFADYRLAPGAPVVRPREGAYVLYKITRIVNTKPKAAAFAFEPKRVLPTTGSTGRGVETALLGTYLAGGLTVGASQEQRVGRCVIRQAPAIAPQAIDLLYRDEGQQAVTMVRSSTTVRAKVYTGITALLMKVVSYIPIKGSMGAGSGPDAPKVKFPVLETPTPAQVQAQCGQIVF